MEGHNQRDYSKSVESARELEELIQYQEHVWREDHRLRTSPSPPLSEMVKKCAHWLFTGAPQHVYQ